MRAEWKLNQWQQQQLPSCIVYRIVTLLKTKKLSKYLKNNNIGGSLWLIKQIIQDKHKLQWEGG